MLKKSLVFVAPALALVGTLLVSRAAHSSTFEYPGAMCDHMFSTASASLTKSGYLYTSGSWADIVCPLVSTSLKSFTVTRIRTRSASTNPGGSCTFYTKTATGGIVASVTRQLSTTPNTDYSPTFGTVSFANASYAYISCYIPPGTRIYNYFANQPD